MEMVTENYCDQCDNVLHAVFDEKEFYAHNVGRIACPECGTIAVPCNECEDYKHKSCDNDCPWKKAKITTAMSDEEYIRWIRKNQSKVYEVFRSGKNGDHYLPIIRKIEAEDK